MKKILLFCLTLFIAAQAWGQTTYTTNFDGTDELNYSNTGGSVLSGSASHPTSNGSNPAYGNTNSGFVGNDETATITTSSISTANTSSFSFDLASLAGTSGNGADGTDDVTVEVSIDGGSNYTTVVTVDPSSNNTQWTYTGGGSSVSTDYSSPVTQSPAGGGNRDDDNDGIAQVTITDIPSGNIVVRIIMTNNSGNEFWAIDNMVLTEAAASCTAPSTPAANFSASSIADNSMNISFTRGDGDNVLVVAKAGSAVDADPTSGTSYTANAAFGSGDEIGTGNFVVHNGTANSFTLSGLAEATEYHFAIYEYNNTGVCYLTPAHTGNATTTCSTPQPVTGVTTSIGDGQITLNWTTPTGSCPSDGIVVFAREGSAVEAIISEATLDGLAEDSDFNAANADWSARSNANDFFDLTFGGTDNTNYAVYNGTGNSVTITGLTNGTAYHFRIFNEGGSSEWSTAVDADATPNVNVGANIVFQMINACGSDLNEFVVFKTTAALDIDNFALSSRNDNADTEFNFSWRSANTSVALSDIANNVTATTNDYLIYDPNTDAATISTRYTAITDASVVGTNTNVFQLVPSTGIIPANSTVIFFLGNSFDDPANNLPFTDASYNNANLYILFGNGTLVGFFSNSNTRLQELYANGEVSSFTYNPAGSGEAAYVQSDGNFVSNGACVPPLQDLVLPVELINFRAALINESTYLTWATASEENNSHFVVERSTNGRDFKAIATVEGNGTTVEPQAYNFVDAAPANGINYYRLKQVDFDGAFAYSDVVSIEIQNAKNDVVLLPNPVTADLNVQLPTTWTGETSIEIFDIAGRLVQSEIISDNATTFQLAGINNGQYIIRIINADNVITKRFVKQ